MFPSPSPETPGDRLLRKVIGKCVFKLRGGGIADPEIRETILGWTWQENDRKEAALPKGGTARFRHQLAAQALVTKTARMVDEILGSAKA